MSTHQFEHLIYDTIPQIAIVILFITLIIILFDGIKMIRHTKLKALKKAFPKDAHGIIWGRKGKMVVYSPVEQEGSAIVLSATGTGKTAALGVPTLRSWTGTSFTIDISGDVCKNCPNMPNKLIFEPDNSSTTPYNIFGVIDDLQTVEEKNEALEQLAFLLMPEPQNMNENAKFFLVNGRKILTASLIAFYHSGMDFIKICEKIMSSNWKSLFREIDATGNQAAQMYITSFDGANEANNAGCAQSCVDAIKLFATNANIKNCVRRPSKGELALEPKHIENHNIFIIVSDPKLALYSPLLNILVSQQMQYISNRVITKDSNHILLFLDEFASLRIDVQLTLEALRKYRKRLCRIIIMSQNLADLDILYGHEVTKALVANFSYKVLLGGLSEPESQKYFAELLGYKKRKKQSISKNVHQTTVTECMEKEYIIEPADLDRQGKDTVLLIAPNEPGGFLKLKKNYYFKEK